MSDTTSESETIPHAQVVGTARAEGLARPLEMRPPSDPDGPFGVRSAAPSRSEHTELVIDRCSGDVLARVDLADQPVVAQAVSWGISFHQGEANGQLNRVQYTAAPAAAFAPAVSGFVAWWMRRPGGRLGVAAGARRGDGLARGGARRAADDPAAARGRLPRRGADPGAAALPPPRLVRGRPRLSHPVRPLAMRRREVVTGGGRTPIAERGRPSRGGPWTKAIMRPATITAAHRMRARRSG